MWYLVMPYVKHACVLLALARPHIRHLYVLLTLVMPQVRNARLSLHIALILKDRTTRIWSFGCSFICATTMGCTGFRLSFGIIVLL